MQFNIPTIGAKIRLLEDWSFPCFTGHGNTKFIWAMRPETEEGYSGVSSQSFVITLQKGTVLALRRIYIRQNKQEWDSVTFGLVEVPLPPSDKPKKKTTKKASGRFWVKLRDANEIQYEPIED